LYKYVDRDVLPSDYGGTLGKIENMRVRDATLQFDDYFREVKKMAEDNRGKF
jgi:hypothetical protein